MIFCYLLKLLLLLLFLLLCLLLQKVQNGLFSEVVSCIVNLCTALRRSRHSAAGVTRAVLTSNASGMWGTLESELSKQQCWPFLSVRYALSRFRSQIVRKSQLNGFPGHRRFRGNQGHRRSIFEIFVNRRNTGVVKTTGFRYIRRKSRGEWGEGVVGGRSVEAGDYGAGRDPKMPLFAQPTALSARKEIINGQRATMCGGQYRFVMEGLWQVSTVTVIQHIIVMS